MIKKDTFIQQGHIKLIKNDLFFYVEIFLFQIIFFFRKHSIHQIILQK